jgi:hypothetical protein
VGSWHGAPQLRRRRFGLELGAALALARDAYSAISVSCVTTSTVMPEAPSSWNSAMISTLVRESRLPVGSSATMIFGRDTIARATATRCCWPPDIWFGW